MTLRPFKNKVARCSTPISITTIQCEWKWYTIFMNITVEYRLQKEETYWITVPQIFTSTSFVNQSFFFYYHTTCSNYPSRAVNWSHQLNSASKTDLNVTCSPWNKMALIVVSVPCHTVPWGLCHPCTFLIHRGWPLNCPFAGSSRQWLWAFSELQAPCH